MRGRGQLAAVQSALTFKPGGLTFGVLNLVLIDFLRTAFLRVVFVIFGCDFRSEAPTKIIPEACTA